MAEQSPRHRWKGRVLFLVLGVGVGMIGTWVSSLKPIPIPPLLEKLPSPFAHSDRNQVFTERLRAQFHVGTPEANLIRELWLQGFSPVTEWQGSQRAVEFDTFGKGGFAVCRTRGHVTWSADDNGRLRDISGSYSWSCL